MAKTTWQLDPAHSEITFRVRHLVIATVSGKFTKFSANVSTEDDDFTTSDIEFEAETASIDTGIEARDNHLRSDDFFNSEKFPTLLFKSTGMKNTGGNEFQLDGNLTIRDVTKPISLKVEFGGTATDPYGNFKSAFEVMGSLNRKEFGLRWDALTEAGGAVVSDEVKIHANVQFAKA
ncbi:MAG: YceI family protein [Saprospiraceae bacterium]|nr:YceI family protein [Saprospiraceae bacterium]